MTMSTNKKLTIDMIPQTWIDYYNGPNAGLISIATAKKESPWLISGAKIVTIADNSKHR